MLYLSRFLFTILINPVLLRFYPQIFLKTQIFNNRGQTMFSVN